MNPQSEPKPTKPKMSKTFNPDFHSPNPKQATQKPGTPKKPVQKTDPLEKKINSTQTYLASFPFLTLIALPLS